MSNYNSHNVSSAPNLQEEIKKLVRTEAENLIKEIAPDNQKNQPDVLNDYCERVSSKVAEKVDNPMRDKKLSMLYDHEKNLLNILKEYKEEIKFASSLQADIRKEASTFFSSTLKEVCNSLKESQIDQSYQVKWILDLVSSYTSSLNLSSRLAEEHVINLLGDIQKEATETINKG